jgi:S1-C subfamily serine protease
MLALALALALGTPAFADDSNAVDNAVVQVLVTAQEVDPFTPWQKRAPYTRQGYGVVVDSTRVITLESLTRNATLVEIQCARSAQKIPAAVELADSQVDLAVLRVKPGAVPGPARRTSLTGYVKPAATLQAVQFDNTLEIQKGGVQFLRVSMAGLPAAPYSTLLYTLLVDIAINGHGAAVINDGKLAGLILSYDRSARTATMVPGPTIQRFMDDVAAPPYKGFAYAGFVWQPLVDPVKRDYLGVRQDGRGVVMLAALPGSGAFGALKPSDVILEWDGHAVDTLGFYEDEELGRMALPYLIQGRRKPGDTVPARVVRNRQELVVNVPLSRRDEASSLIPEDVEGEQPKYLVDGGLMIRELTGRYLKARGNDWLRNVDPRLAHTYLTRQHLPATPGERVVVLTGVLPDPINIDYQDFRDEVVLAVNGQPVRNMDDVFRAVAADGHVRRLRLQSIGVDIVLDAAQLTSANARLARLYRLPSLRYPPLAKEEPPK